MQQLILDEVNVKELRFADAGMLEKKVKCNFRVMGKKFGKLMKAVNQAVTALPQADIAALEQQGSLTLQVEGETVVVDRADVEIISEDMPGWTVANEGALTVALDLTITPELRNEGLAREIVKRIQTYRKESGFEITDRVALRFEQQPVVDEVLQAFSAYIASQVLADSIEVAATLGDEAVTVDLDDCKARVEIRVTK